MASVAFAAIAGPGALALGPVGLALGGAAAAYLDNAVIFPALFPQDPVQGPRVKDLRISEDSEGAPYVRCFGEKNRVGGTVFWKSELKETRTSEEVGGKGGGGQEADNFTYAVDVAVAWAEGPEDGLGIEHVQRVYTNTKILFNKTPGQTIVSDQLTATAETTREWSFALNMFIIGRYVLKIDAPADTVTLDRFRSGHDVASSGWANAENNGTFRCVQARTLPSGIVRVVLSRDDQAFVTEAAGQTVTLQQDTTTGLERFHRSQVEDITHFTGTETQTAPSLITADTTTSPGFRGMAYSLLKNLQLADFGNTIPTFGAEIDAREGDTVGEAVGAILERAGRSASDYDTTDVDAIVLSGYAIRGPQSPRSSLGPILMAFDIYTREVRGVLEFRQRGNAPEVTIDTADLAAHAIGNDAPRKIRIKDRKEHGLPKTVNVSYIDVDDPRLQSASQSAIKLNTLSNAVLNVDLPIAITAIQAKNIAERILWTAWANRREVTLQLPPSYVHVQEGDVLTFTLDGKDWRVFVLKADSGANGLIVIDGVEEVDALLTFTSAADERQEIRHRPQYLAGETDLSLIEVGCLRDEDAIVPGFYIAASMSDPTVPFRPLVIYESKDGGSSFTAVLVQSSEAAQGTALAELGGVACPNLFDEENSLLIRVDNYTPSSADMDDVLAGTNRVLIGQEVVGYRTVVAEGDDEYTISGLLRGLAGTEDFVEEHAVGERAVFLSAGGVLFNSVNTSAIGTARQYKAVPQGSLESDYDATEILVQARCFWPLSPSHVQGERQTDNDWEIEWSRRTRLNFNVLENDTLPLLDTPEAYEIDVLNVGTGVVLNTYTSSTPSLDYTAALQTNDYGSAQATIRVAVYQMSDVIGRGKGTDVILTG
ncbi:MAG: hypothetical protein GY716_15770 [bacterium]|nr:hypothetical protein [bacterium]